VWCLGEVWRFGDGRSCGDFDDGVYILAIPPKWVTVDSGKTVWRKVERYVDYGVVFVLDGGEEEGKKRSIGFIVGGPMISVNAIRTMEFSRNLGFNKEEQAS